MVYRMQIVWLCCCLSGAFAFAQDAATAPVVKESAPSSQTSFEGRWITTFGELELKRSGKFFVGTYPGGTLKGAVFGNSLAFRYQDQAERGQAKFELSKDGSAFTGKYRPTGANDWRKWDGRRAQPRGFAGLWDTSYGKLRLTVSGKKVSGAYDFSGADATVEGEIQGNKLTFRYTEPETKGTAWFELDENDETFSGKYRADGDSVWQPWEGQRVAPVMGEKWLVILEANWEGSLGEKQYAFAEMLRQYFTMSIARHVKVRTRSFHDSADLKRFCREIKYLPGPVVLLLSTHGTKDGLTVFNETITPQKLADGLTGASNLDLIHLSGCSMMAGDFPKQVQKLMSPATRCPISGYKTNVAWDASALGDFTFLSMLLIHRMTPVDAVQHAIKLSPYLGDKTAQRMRYRPLGLSIQN